eukprot:scaffold827_cov369-Prasinococcus_capsulatus_cf.AAC.21
MQILGHLPAGRRGHHAHAAGQGLRLEAHYCAGDPVLHAYFEQLRGSCRGAAHAHGAEGQIPLRGKGGRIRCHLHDDVPVLRVPGLSLVIIVRARREQQHEGAYPRSLGLVGAHAARAVASAVCHGDARGVGAGEARHQGEAVRRGDQESVDTARRPVEVEEGAVQALEVRIGQRLARTP